MIRENVFLCLLKKKSTSNQILRIRRIRIIRRLIRRTLRRQIRILLIRTTIIIKRRIKH